MARYRSDTHFIPVPYGLLLDPELKADHVAAWTACRSYCDFGKETGAKISDADAAERAGMPERTFRRARADLRKRGWLDWKRTGRGNDYTVRSARDENSYQEPTPQIGHPGRSDPPGRPIVITNSQTEDGDTTVSPANGDTWMTPFMNLHAEILGGRLNAGKWVRTFRPLLDEHGEAAVLDAQRHYLENLRATARQEFLDYNKMAESFGTWLGPQQRAGRPTRRIDGKDFNA